MDDLHSILSLLPWWACLIVAAIAFLGLHHLAGLPTPAPRSTVELADTVGRTMWKTLASMGQYLVPVVCLIAALSSALAGRKRQELVEEVRRGVGPDVLQGMSWRDFEILVGESFRRQGYEVYETGGGGADGGVDLIMRRDGEKFLVQAKQWKAFKVGVQVVRELYGVMAAERAAGGFVVTSGTFTKEAAEFASGRNMRLIDGRALQILLKNEVEARGPKATQAESRVPDAERGQPESSPGIPTCPLCSSSMVRRVSRKGANSGSSF